MLSSILLPDNDYIYYNSIYIFISQELLASAFFNMQTNLKNFKESKETDNKDYCYPCFKDGNKVEKEGKGLDNYFGAEKFRIYICPNCKRETD